MGFGKDAAEKMTDRFTSQEITKLLGKLIGGTTAIGDSTIDHEIEKNLKTLIDVVNWCLDGIVNSADTRHNYQGSMRVIGERAFSAMNEWQEWLKAQIDEVSE